MGKTVYPDSVVAMIRAATHAGMRHKLIAKATGASDSLIGQISEGRHRPDIQPDPTFYEKLRSLFIVSPDTRSDLDKGA